MTRPKRLPRNFTAEQKAAHEVHKIERQIATKLVEELLEGGYELATHDGVSYTSPRTRDKRLIHASLFIPNIATVLVYRPGDKTSYGWVELVYGNKGYDVIHDNATCIEDHIVDTLALAEKLEGEVHGG